jgi:hypothetical protein
MSRAWSTTRVYFAYTGIGLAMGVLLSIVVVWNYVDRYFWRPDGSLSRDAFASNYKGLRANRDTGGIELVEPPERLSRTEKAWVGCQESLPIWLAGGCLGLGAALIHLRIRARFQADPERQSYDDSIRTNSPPPVT